MPFSLLPSLILDRTERITPQLLIQQDIRLLMLDFDNTIVPYTTNEPTPAMAAWLQMIRDCGIPVCVVSNSRNDRVKIFCAKYGLDCITHAKKPFSKGIRECLQRYGVAASQSALVGDQIYTDTLGANCAGVKSILVKAIDNHNFWLKARHVLEKPMIFAARKRRIDL